MASSVRYIITLACGHRITRKAKPKSKARCYLCNADKTVTEVETKE